jgi:hypothetical protein
VNHRRSKQPSFRIRKAVSDKFISRATSCIHEASRGSASKHTAAGLPANGASVKESTWVMAIPIVRPFFSWSAVTANSMRLDWRLIVMAVEAAKEILKNTP